MAGRIEHETVRILVTSAGLDSARRTRELFLSLGLVIAHQTATAHGGKIIYLSRSGGGEGFRLILPVKQENQQLSIRF